MNTRYTLKEINRNARRNEEKLAKTLAKATRMSHKISSDLEWVLTWKLKTISFENPLWCDGFEKLKIREESKRAYSVSGVARIGFESNVSVIDSFPFTGFMELSSHSKYLKSYGFVFKNEMQEYVVVRKSNKMLLQRP